MSLDKSTQHGKDHRKPYRGAKTIDRTCRNHGGCEWCRGNREYANRKRKDVTVDKLKECGEIK